MSFFRCPPRNSGFPVVFLQKTNQQGGPLTQKKRAHPLRHLVSGRRGHGHGPWPAASLLRRPAAGGSGLGATTHFPKFLDSKAFGKTILAVNQEFRLFFGQSTQEGRAIVFFLQLKAMGSIGPESGDKGWCGLQLSRVQREGSRGLQGNYIFVGFQGIQRDPGAIKGFTPTSVKQGNPVFLRGLVFGRPFWLYHISEHFPQPWLRLLGIFLGMQSHRSLHIDAARCQLGGRPRPVAGAWRREGSGSMRGGDTSTLSHSCRSHC